MLGTIVIAHDGSDRSAAAVGLGRAFMRFAAQSVVVALPYGRESVASPALASGGLTRQEAWKTLDAMGAELETLPDVRYRAIAGATRAQALHAVAAQEGADLVVVADSDWGGVVARLLHHSPCPVAIARGGRGEEPPLARLAVAYDGGRPAEAALALGRALAQAPGSPVASADVLCAGDAREPAQPPTDGSGGAAWRTLRLPGEAGDALLTASADYDVLVCGSRDHGPLRRVLLGSVSARLAHAGQCPVVVVPRGSRV